MARLKIVPISIPLWQIVMTTGKETNIICSNGLPDGAELINSFYQGNPPTAYLVFYHESFDDIPEGGMMPTLVPEFLAIKCPLE